MPHDLLARVSRAERANIAIVFTGELLVSMVARGTWVKKEERSSTVCVAHYKPNVKLANAVYA